MKSSARVIIFDVDGVLVDVRGSFHTTVLETVRFFTGKRVTAGAAPLEKQVRLQRRLEAFDRMGADRSAANSNTTK